MNELSIFCGTIIAAIIAGAPKFLARCVWVIFLLAIMKPVIGMVVKLINNFFERGKVDPLLRTFLTSLVKTIVYIVFFFLIVAGIGIKATSLVALLGKEGRNGIRQNQYKYRISSRKIVCSIGKDTARC